MSSAPPAQWSCILVHGDHVDGFEEASASVETVRTSIAKGGSRPVRGELPCVKVQSSIWGVISIVAVLVGYAARCHRRFQGLSSLRTRSKRRKKVWKKCS